MKSPLARISVAAVVVLGRVIALQTVMKPSVALADVLIQIERVAAYMYQASNTWIGESPEPGQFDSDAPAIVLVSQELGYAEKVIMGTRTPDSTEDKGMEMFILPEKKKAVTINHKDQQYFEIDFDEDMMTRQRGQRDARAIVRQVLNCKYERLGHDTIDGIDCEGFRTTDPTYAGGLFGDVRIELWVDVKTYLPVRLETDTRIDENKRLITISDHFQWDIEVDAQEFEPVIPSGYTAPMQDAFQMPAMNEETLLKGLRLCVKLESPTYPNDLTMQSMMSIMVQFQQKMQQFQQADDKEAVKAFFTQMFGVELSEEKPSQEQMTKMVTNITMTAQGPCLVYATLMQDQKDPAYHGDVVTPQDADQVLVRWKVSDSEYRVIFGDLRAETVSAETLTELEKALPK